MIQSKGRTPGAGVCEEDSMSQVEPENETKAETAALTRIVAVYPTHDLAEKATRRLIEEGFAMKDVSIVGRDFQATEGPIGFVSTKDFAEVGAGTGAWVGGLFGLLIGAAFLVLPGVGPVVVAGPIAAALLGALEGALAGAALGALSGALVGWGVPKDQALKYESQIKVGKFLVIARGTPELVEKAKAILIQGQNDGIEIYDEQQAA
jgi:uncharacterized membrane protein